MLKDEMIVFPIWKSRDFSISENMCFIVMPFDKKYNKIYDECIRTTLSKFNMEALRSDECTTHEIIEGIWIKINEARVIIVDVTGQNPNVMYELGIAHVLGKPIILLSSDKADKLPFDIRNYRHIIYKRSKKGLQKLQKELEHMVNQLLQNNPTGDKLYSYLKERAKNWKDRFYDSMVLGPETLLPKVRKQLDCDNIKDLELAFCLATSTHYCSIDNIIFWARKCKYNPLAAQHYAHLILAHHSRPKYRAAFIIEKFHKDTKSLAIKTILSHKKDFDKNFINSIENSTISSYVKNNSGRDLSETYQTILLKEFESIIF